MNSPRFRIDPPEYVLEARRKARESLGISDREARRYSLGRALLDMSEKGHLTAYELEVETEARKKNPGTVSGSIMLPTGLPLQRDMTASVPANGGNVVGTNLRGDAFIDLLRERMLFARMGATVLSGLVGNVAIPKLSAGATAYWLVNEATGITESQPTLGQIVLTPHNVGAVTEFSRQLLIQSTPGIDQVIANDLAQVVAQAIDTAVLNGTNADGQPAGLGLVGGLGSFSVASCDHAKLQDGIVDVAASNALGPNCAFVTTPTISAALKQRHKVSGTFSPLWEGNVMEGKIDGFNAYASPKVAANTVWFGAWDQLILAEWGTLEIAINPYQNFNAGVMAVRAMQSIDIAFRSGGAFSYANDFS